MNVRGVVGVLAIRFAADLAAPDAVVLPVRAPGRPGEAVALVPTAVDLPPEVLAEAAALIAQVDHAGRAGEVADLPRPLRSPARVILVGIGDGAESEWRAAGAAAARVAPAPARVTVSLPAEVSSAVVRAVAEGLWLATYRFSADGGSRAGDGGSPAGGDSGGEPALREVVLAVPDPDQVADGLAAARVTAEATYLARDLTNMPSSVKNPAWFAEAVAEAAAGHPGLAVNVREPEQLAAEGFGGILAVGAGSVSEPRFVEVEWRPADARTGHDAASPPPGGAPDGTKAVHVVLVGKGITFDTGGISIKPCDGMKLMRKDMAGAAAVVAATIGAAALDLPVRITALAPLAENMLGGAALRPGDVIRHYGGVTSESTNSDAEGRLVLADALAYAVDRLAPDLLVDLATLTGANAVALGRRTAALYSENDALAEALYNASVSAGEQVWRMPLPADYVEYLGSEVADLHSSPDRGAGSVVAALFLREFTGPLRQRWLHLDMSAPSWADSAEAELAAGATGWGVRTLLRWLPVIAARAGGVAATAEAGGAPAASGSAAPADGGATPAGAGGGASAA